MRPLLLLLCVACGGRGQSHGAPLSAAEAAPAATPSPLVLEIEGLAAPSTPEEKQRVRVAEGLKLGGVRAPLRYQALMRSGDLIGGKPYGLIVDVAGQPVLDDQGKPVDCGGADFTGLLQAHGALFLTQHVECVPAALYLTKLTQEADGTLRPVSTAPVDESGVSGAINHCAGQITPWGTHLASEEYETDARTVAADGSIPKDDYGWRYMARYLRKPLAEVDPYDYGWIPELTVTDAQGSTRLVKHYAMGRFSHELALVLPDERTVYLSDDGAGGGLFLFVADKARELSSGRLFAARWQQGADATAALSWIDLGHTTDAEIAKAVVDGRTRFEDLFDAAPPVAGACPAGLSSIRTMTGTECLRVKAGKELLASRLETRRYAALLGATTELNKGEGLTWDPGRQAVYFATSTVGGGMLAGDPKGDAGGPDHLRLAKNDCGAVWALETSSPASEVEKLAGSRLGASRAKVVVQGRERSYADVPGMERNSCDVDAIANPDNLAFIPEADLLIVAEDSRRHENMVLWAIHMGTGVHTRLLTAPWGGELTGTAWFPDVGGRGYLTVTVQHPFRADFLPKGFVVPAGEDRTITGVIGPFPAELSVRR